MFHSRHAVNAVFTPRRTEVNREIYVDRIELEKELRRSLSGSLHSIIFGESGSGKSWLYKKVLSDMGAVSAIANCANALRFDSITEEIRSIVASGRPKRAIEVSEEMSTSLNVAVAQGGLKSTTKYEFADKDPLRECFRMIRDEAGKGPAVLVIDNLEMIFSSRKLMDELASIITLLDDERYSEHAVKVLIVGVPNGVKDYLSKVSTSVANRIAEMSEIASLSSSEVSMLVQKGFVDLLQVSFPDDVLRQWQEHVFTVTMGFAQHVQEYCEQLGYVVEDAKWTASPGHLLIADSAWLKQGLSQESGIIARLMNERETKVGRRNQVLFALGKVNKRVFHVVEIETLVRTAFPVSTTDTTLAVGQILSELSGGEGESAIIRRSAKGPTYEFRDARFAMALRVLLQKDPTREKVTKVD